MDVYIQERLFQPLGIKKVTWTLDRAGNPHVMSGCQIRPKDFIKLGQLLLDGGEYNGTTVISALNIKKVVEPCERYNHYGLLWWLKPKYTPSVVDDEVIAELERKEIDEKIIQKVAKLKGTYQDNDAFFEALLDVFPGSEYQALNELILEKDIKVRKKQFEAWTYQALGFLGNYLIVDPQTKTIAVRMISWNSFDSSKPDGMSGEDNFHDFPQRVFDLMDTMK